VVARRGCEGFLIDRSEIGQWVSLEMPPEHLDRVDVWSIWRQELSMNFTVALEELVDDLGPMGHGAVADDDERLLELHAEVPQKLNHAASREVGVGEQGKVKSDSLSVRRDCQRRDGRDFLVPSSAVKKNRRFATRSPRPTDQWSHQKAALVDEDDVGLQETGFFLMRDQSSRIHFCTAFSSRSRARFSGFCGVHPMERSNLPI